MQRPVKPEAAYDITVTSTTQTPEQLAKDLGVEPEAPVLPEASATTEEGGEPVAKVDEISEFDKKLDELEPPTKADETPAEKAERRSRSTSKVLKEIALRKQADDKAKAAEERAAKAEKELNELRAKPPAAKAPDAPVTAPPAKPADAPLAAGTKPAQDFEFPTWEEYQEQHPEADIREYTIALSDARDDFRSAKKAHEAAVAAAQKEDEEAFTTFSTAVTEFKASHADYETVLDAIALPPDVVDPKTGKPSRDPLVVDLERLVTKAGAVGPEVLYYLGQPEHKAEATRLLASKSPTALHLAFGEICGTVRALKGRAAAAPATEITEPPAPARPVSKAPAPVSPIPAGSSAAKTATDIGNDDDEDADAYIDKRRASMRRAG